MGINLLNASGIFKKLWDLFGWIKVSWEGSFGPYFWKTGHLQEISKKQSVCLSQLEGMK